jgi:hypothetical protein
MPKGARTALTYAIYIQIHKAPNSNSKSPFTKLMEVISYCSISFSTYTLIESVAFRASESS